jgi:hypothetical protein
MSPPLDSLVRSSLEKFSTRLADKDMRSLIPRDGLPYLYRAYLEGGDTPDGEPGLFLHKFVASDDENLLHCHPWRWSVSFILSGRYREIRSQHDPRFATSLHEVVLEDTTTQRLEPGDTNFIGMKDFHSVEILTPEVWTLFLHGPRAAQWGFVKKTPRVRQTIAISQVRTKDRTITGRVRKTS